jgi:2-iminobutanoate/2-iminopropanoate deaminase
MRDVISTQAAPAAIGPYSQAIRAGDFVFVSGQIPLDPASGAPVDGDVRVQAERVLRNLQAVLQAAGGTCADVVKTTVYLADLSDFGAMNEVYATFFTSAAPARATVQVSRLPRNVRVEIDAVAYIKQQA